jgi:hypothetical protein
MHRGKTLISQELAIDVKHIFKKKKYSERQIYIRYPTYFSITDTPATKAAPTSQESPASSEFFFTSTCASAEVLGTSRVLTSTAASCTLSEVPSSF